MNRTVVLVQIYPNRVEVIEISAETKARTGTLECLRFGPRRRVLVVCPLFTNAGVRSKPVNGYLETTTTFAATAVRVLSQHDARSSHHLTSVAAVQPHSPNTSFRRSV